jgi:hypothetical protein
VTRLALAPELALVRAHAPEALLELDAAYEAAKTTLDPELAEALRLRVEQSGEERGGIQGETVASPAVLAFADQFVLYVAGVTEEQREAAEAAVGEEALRDVARALYVFDLTWRLRRTLGRLGAGASDPVGLPSPAAKPLGTALADYHAAAMRLDALDPVTTELVRLHCARYHDCKT